MLADYNDIEDKNYSFSAGQYFEIRIEYIDITPEEFQTQLNTHIDNLKNLFNEGDDLQQSILSQLKELRYA